MVTNVTNHAIERSYGLFKVGSLKKYCTSMAKKAYELLRELKKGDFSCVVRDYNKNISTFIEFAENEENIERKKIIATITTVGTLIKYPREGEDVIYYNEDKTFAIRKWSKEKHVASRR